MSTRNRALGLLAIASLPLAGCEGAKRMAGSIRELQAVQREVARSFGNAEVQVNLSNGRFLSISMVNSPLGSLPEKERAAKALEIARVAFQSFASRASLERVSVSFVEHKSYGVLKMDNTTGAFQFGPHELGGEGGGPKPRSPPPHD